MISATSPAANHSPSASDAIMAMATSTSALISCLRTSPVAASHRIGAPHRMMATQAGSTGRSPPMMRDTISDTAETARINTERFTSSSKKSLILPILSDGYAGILRIYKLCIR